jgi:hypothetical protein
VPGEESLLEAFHLFRHDSALDDFDAARPRKIMTVCRVMPFRKQSGVGVWITPSPTKNTLAPVASATWPRQSSMSASAKPFRSAACFDNVQIM